MRILITGATGFAGGHLVEALLAQRGHEIQALSRRGMWPSEWAHLHSQISPRACDVNDAEALGEILRTSAPEQIYHLAGYASTGGSFKDPDAAWTGNLGATRALYHAVRQWGGRPRILFVGTGLIYGDAEFRGVAYDEEAPLRPTSPYAASKAAADLLSYQVNRSEGLDIVRARPFNHIGPCQSPEFAVAHFAKQIAAIMQAGRPGILETGNLEARRDLTDVRDTIRAYMLLMERGRSGEAYNVGTGRLVSMRDVVDRLVSEAGIPVEVRTRAELVRGVDAAAVWANAGKLRRETGWEPKLPLEQTLRETLDNWKRRL